VEGHTACGARPGLPAGADLSEWGRFADAATLAALLADAVPGPADCGGVELACALQGSAPSLRINEVAASQASAATDARGAFEDYVELYNPTDAAIELGADHDGRYCHLDEHNEGCRNDGAAPG
jgi:hypothetical protein